MCTHMCVHISPKRSTLAFETNFSPPFLFFPFLSMAESFFFIGVCGRCFRDVIQRQWTCKLQLLFRISNEQSLLAPRPSMRRAMSCYLAGTATCGIKGAETEPMICNLIWFILHLAEVKWNKQRSWDPCSTDVQEPRKPSAVWESFTHCASRDKESVTHEPEL